MNGNCSRDIRVGISLGHDFGSFSDRRFLGEVGTTGERLPIGTVFVIDRTAGNAEPIGLDTPAMAAIEPSAKRHASTAAGTAKICAIAKNDLRSGIADDRRVARGI
jgi:hypothetical protein